MKGVNRQKGDPNYDLYQLAIKSTTKRLYPNYCNVDWSVNKGYDRNNPEEYVATMGGRKPYELYSKVCVINVLTDRTYKIIGIIS